MRVEVVNIERVRKNPTNPRIIKNNKFELLKQSIRDLPEMLHLREIVVDSDYMILGGNMRYEALKDLGYKEITVKVADNLTEEQKQEFIIKDNSNFGEWDYDELANSWNFKDLTSWGLDLPVWDDNQEKYTNKIGSPIYKITKEKSPDITELYNADKYRQLVRNIDDSDLSENQKEFLRIAACRHIVFNYSKIAEYYAHTNLECKELMEQSALIIIDYDKAIEYGYAELLQTVAKLVEREYDEA